MQETEAYELAFSFFSPSGISKTRNQRLVSGGNFYRGEQFKVERHTAGRRH
jgi:hypothetical protein